jgi:secondary thiamine-phosphate synthase enzyme
MPGRLHGVMRVTPQIVASGTLSLATRGPGLVEFTPDAAAFLAEVGASDGLLLVFLHHTSASLTIQENADPDVRADLMAALARLAPEDAGWTHDAEGADDMPAHVKTMLTGVSLHAPVTGGRLALGTWQGLYLVEHRRAPHRREITLQFVGSAVDSDRRLLEQDATRPR